MRNISSFSSVFMYICFDFPKTAPQRRIVSIANIFVNFEFSIIQVFAASCNRSSISLGFNRRNRFHYISARCFGNNSKSAEILATAAWSLWRSSIYKKIFGRDFFWIQKQSEIEQIGSCRKHTFSGNSKKISKNPLSRNCQFPEKRPFSLWLWGVFFSALFRFYTGTGWGFWTKGRSEWYRFPCRYSVVIWW